MEEGHGWGMGGGGVWDKWRIRSVREAGGVVTSGRVQL